MHGSVYLCLCLSPPARDATMRVQQLYHCSYCVAGHKRCHTLLIKPSFIESLNSRLYHQESLIGVGNPIFICDAA